MRILFALALASYHVCEGAIYPIALEVTDTLAYIYSEVCKQVEQGLLVAIDS